MVSGIGTTPTTSNARPVVVRGRQALAVLYIGSAVVHVVLATVNAGAYRHFADDAPVAFVSSAWENVFMADPEAWALTLALGEILLASALLMGGGWRRFGYAGVVAFHIALTLFGWGFWLWSGPALAIIAPLAIADLRRSR
jgi:hypothetical protein